MPRCIDGCIIRVDPGVNAREGRLIRARAATWAPDGSRDWGVDPCARSRQDDHRRSHPISFCGGGRGGCGGEGGVGWGWGGGEVGG